MFELVARTVSKIGLYPDAKHAVVPYIGGSGALFSYKSLTVRVTPAS